MSVPSPPPEKFWVLFSGGKDSATAAHLLHSEGRLAGVVHIDTGIAIPELRSFVMEVCDVQGWPLEIIKTTAVYEELVLKWGFPGYAQHGVFMSWLKGRAIRIFKKRHPGEALASGVRRFESNRRLRQAEEWSRLEGVLCHAPIYRWRTFRVWDYVTTHGLPRSPCYETLGISGDCICGAFAARGEVEAIRKHYPEVAKRIEDLERKVALAGCVRNRKCWKWGWGNGNVGFAAGEKQATLENFLCGGCQIDRGL